MGINTPFEAGSNANTTASFMVQVGSKGKNLKNGKCFYRSAVRPLTKCGIWMYGVCIGNFANYSYYGKDAGAILVIYFTS